MAGTNKNKRPAEDEPKQPAKANKTGTLPVFSKPKLGTVASPRKNPDNNTDTRALCISGTSDGCSLAWIEGKDQLPSFNFPMASYLRDDPNRSRAKFKVDLQQVRRDPTENKVWEFPPKKLGGSKVLFNIMIHVPDSVNEDGPKFRNKWGPLLVSLHNMPRFIKELYGENNHAYFAGDLTPTSGKKPYLSDYFTFKHTLLIMQYAYSNSKMDDLVAEDTVMKYYFPVNKIEEVRKYYAEHIQPRNRDHNNGEQEAPFPEWQD
jgi:hypothetical protein